MPLTQDIQKLFDSMPSVPVLEDRWSYRANKHFQSLSESERARLTQSFGNTADSKEFKIWFTCRYRCLTDLFFLVNDVLTDSFVKNGDENLIREETHRDLANTFVQKDPSKSLKEQSSEKNRLILCPRGTLKTTFDVGDVIQWILCFPDVRILFECAEKGLALGFIKEVSDIFKLPDEGTALSLFQQLFPDYCVAAINIYQNHFDCPLRKRKGREWTVMAGSMESSMSGWHFDVLCVDDSVTNNNSYTVDALQKTIKNFWINKKMLMPFGYLNLIGTRYHVDDLYGNFLRKAKPGSYTELVRTAWTVKPHVLAMKKEVADYTADDVVLNYPQMLSLEYLKGEYAADAQSFGSQLMNDPIAAMDVMFTEDLVRAHTIPFDQLPKNGRIIIAWDLAYSIKKGRDFSCAAIGCIDNDGRLFIIEIIRGRFNPTELAQKIALCFHNYNPYILEIEDAGGAQFLNSQIQEFIAQYGTQGHISWIPALRNKDAKRTRINSLHPLLSQNRLYFSASIDCYDAMLGEFIRFNGEEGGHDDIPDSISMLVKHLPEVIIQHDSPQATATNEIMQTLQDKRMHELIFGLRSVAQVAPVVEAPPEPEYTPQNYGGLDDCLGYGLVG